APRRKRERPRAWAAWQYGARFNRSTGTSAAYNCRGRLRRQAKSARKRTAPAPAIGGRGLVVSVGAGSGGPLAIVAIVPHWERSPSAIVKRAARWASCLAAPRRKEKRSQAGSPGAFGAMGEVGVGELGVGRGDRARGVGEKGAGRLG